MPQHWHDKGEDDMLLGTAVPVLLSVQGKANASAIVLRAMTSTLSLEELKDWYPEGVRPSLPRPISWEDMCARIEAHCNLMEESQRMKTHPEDFEHRRNTYPLREEFF